MIYKITNIELTFWLFFTGWQDNYELLNLNNKSMDVSVACPNCQKMYGYKRSLQNHLKYECGKEPAFICMICPKRSHQKGNIIQHLKGVHKICDIEKLTKSFYKKII